MLLLWYDKLRGDMKELEQEILNRRNYIISEIVLAVAKHEKTVKYQNTRLRRLSQNLAQVNQELVDYKNQQIIDNLNKP